MLGPGDEVDGYRLQELIARGTTGDVYRAEHRHIGKRVAIKVLRSDLFQAAADVELFLREMRVVQAPPDARILAALGYGIVGGEAFVVMPLLEGESLRALLAHQTSALEKERTFILG